MRRILATAATLALLVSAFGPIQPVLAAPVNDNFADATVISSLPYDSAVVLDTATSEPGEPSPYCSSPGMLQSVWYAYSPAETVSLKLSSTDGATTLAVYTGSGITNLTQVICQQGAVSSAFQATAGSTIYIQMSLAFYVPSEPVSLRLEVAPAPVADFFFNPYDPSMFDTVQFTDASFDPVMMGFKSQAWNFGDGSTATGCCPEHRYLKDGNYTARLDVTTNDGRSASTTQLISVRTHDVAITRLIAPAAASANQTRQITVGVSNSRYPENVQVTLYKSVPSGFAAVGTTTLLVPVRGPYRTTTFAFSYTFTKEDAAIGKVTFRADASIVGQRDALPADNVAITPPTKVGK